MPANFRSLLAGITRWIGRRLKLDSPGFWPLVLIYAVGIASHIILDAMTSFGTRIWAPISEERVAWDLLFIIDFTFTSIVLLPQVAAWVYADRQSSRTRAISMWILFTIATFGVWKLAAAFQVGFHVYVAVAATLIIALLFFAPSIRDRGFRIPRSTWCQAGTGVTIAYLFACALAHRSAMVRVENFAAANNAPVVRIGALPIPPSLLTWGDAIRTPDGVYQARVDLRDFNPPSFLFAADSPPDAFTARALELPEVKLYWSFARFPLVRASTEDGLHVIEFGENRFIGRDQQRRQPFTYRVAFDSHGNVVEEGWLTDATLIKNPQKPPQAEDTR